MLVRWMCLHMSRKLLSTVQTMTIFGNPLADPLGTRRGPPLVREPQFENRCPNMQYSFSVSQSINLYPVFGVKNIETSRFLGDGAALVRTLWRREVESVTGRAEGSREQQGRCGPEPLGDVACSAPFSAHAEPIHALKASSHFHKL